jgi:hypothetical protein
VPSWHVPSQALDDPPDPALPPPRPPALPPACPPAPVVPPFPPVSGPASPPFEWLDPQDETVTRNRSAVERVSVFIEVVGRSCSRRLRAHGEATEGHGRRTARTVAARADRRAEPTAHEVSTAFATRQVTARAGREVALAAPSLDAQAGRRCAAVRAARNRRRHYVRLREAHAATASLGMECAVAVSRTRAAACGSAETASRAALSCSSSCTVRTGRRVPICAGVTSGAAAASTESAAVRSRTIASAADSKSDQEE